MTVHAKPGDHVVIANGRRYAVVKVRKVTDAKVLTNWPGHGESYRDKHNRHAEILFAGTDTAALLLAERLNKAREDYEAEAGEVSTRHGFIIQAIIREARG